MEWTRFFNHIHRGTFTDFSYAWCIIRNDAIYCGSPCLIRQLWFLMFQLCFAIQKENQHWDQKMSMFVCCLFEFTLLSFDVLFSLYHLVTNTFLLLLFLFVFFISKHQKEKRHWDNQASIGCGCLARRARLGRWCRLLAWLRGGRRRSWHFCWSWCFSWSSW